MTQANNYFPTFLVANFYQPQNDPRFQGWGFCATAARQPQAGLGAPFGAPSTLSFFIDLATRADRGSIPATLSCPATLSSRGPVTRPPVAPAAGDRRQGLCHF